MSHVTGTLPAYLAARQRSRLLDRLIQMVAVLAAAGLVVAAGLLLPRINTRRSDLELRFNPETFRDVPPDIAVLNTTLGPLRGLWVYSLWVQADRLKEEGKFYDAMQRASWICKLQPRMPKVWAFHAWNMAYNISVTRHTPEERWLWVRNGIRLLAEEGIPANPYSIELYKELAWIYLHKIGDIMDDMHWAYKRELATEMQRLLGRPPEAGNAEERIEAFRQIAAAPDSIEALAREHPRVRDLLAALADIGYRPDHQFLIALHDARFRRDRQWLKSAQDPAVRKRDEALLAVVERSEFADVLPLLLATVRKRVLIDEYHMDPGWMLHCMEKYGPIDWRLPQAFALYWSTLGAERCRGVRGSNDIEELNNDRITVFALIDMFERGRLMFTPNLEKPNQSFWWTLADLDFIDALHRTYLEFGKLHEGREDDVTSQYLQTGHINALHHAIRLLYIRGRLYPGDMIKARQFYEYLREHYRDPQGNIREVYRVPMEEFVESEFRDMATMMKTVMGLLTELYEAHFLALMIGRTDEARVYEQRAEQAYRLNLSQKLHMTSERSLLPPIEEIKARVYMMVLLSPVDIEYKARLWRRVPLDLNRMVYDAVRGDLESMYGEEYDLAAAFPEPPEMEAYRKTHADVIMRMQRPQELFPEAQRQPVRREPAEVRIIE